MRKLMLVLVSVLVLCSVSNAQKWDKESYVDEIDNSIIETHMISHQEGLYTNEKSRRNKLKFAILINKKNILLRFKENGEPTQFCSKPSYITVSFDKNRHQRISCYQVDDVVYFGEENYKRFKACILENEEICCFYQDAEEGSCKKYIFKIKRSNLKTIKE